MASKPSFRERVVAEILGHIEAGTAAWLKPWKPGVYRLAPHNPVTNANYRGINALWLEMQGHADPRWMTYRQAQGMDAQVRKGERGTPVEYWQWTETKPVLDEAGQPVRDAAGEPLKRTFSLERPRVFHATVFNASQIEGLEPFTAPEITDPAFAPIPRAEAVLAQGGVPIVHDQGDRAFYRPATDRIHLPEKARFLSAHAYYATALHELGHASGSRTRLNRDLSGGFGSARYAEEELRAELASFMTTTEMGLGHYPERHAGYVQSWLKAVREDRTVLFRAARDAETIKQWILEPALRPELEQRAAHRQAAGPALDADQTQQKAMPPATGRTYLSVPFAEKDRAKAAGARWDQRRTSWYAPEGADLGALKPWMRDDAPAPAAPSQDHQAAFGDACAARGLVLKAPPVMDGQWHRVAVEGDTAGKQSGSYKGFLDDGVPNGLIMNYRAGGAVEKWIATGHRLDPAGLDRLRTESQARQAQQAEDRQAQQRDAAKRAYGLHANAAPAPADHPYLTRKGVAPLADLRVTGDNKLLLPLRDDTGALWNLQTIDAGGAKRFLHQGRKSGLCATIDGDPKGPLLVAEGYATGATLHGATGLGVAVALDAGNLEAVATTLRRSQPGRPLVIAADDDHARPDNPGLAKARAAGQAAAAPVIAPPFTDAERARGLTDWNDLAQARGAAALKTVLRDALARAGLSAERAQTQVKTKTKTNAKPKAKAPALGM